MDANAKLSLLLLVVQLGWNMQAMMADDDFAYSEPTVSGLKCLNLVKAFKAPIGYFEADELKIRNHGSFSLKNNDEPPDTFSVVKTRWGSTRYMLTADAQHILKTQTMTLETFHSRKGFITFVESMVKDKVTSAQFYIAIRLGHTNSLMDGFWVFFRADKAEYPFKKRSDFVEFRMKYKLDKNKDYQTLESALREDKDKKIAPKDRDEWDPVEREIVRKNRQQPTASNTPTISSGSKESTIVSTIRNLPLTQPPKFQLHELPLEEQIRLVKELYELRERNEREHQVRQLKRVNDFYDEREAQLEDLHAQDLAAAAALHARRMESLLSKAKDDHNLSSP